MSSTKITRTRGNAYDKRFGNPKSIFFDSKKILYIRTHPEELLAHIVWKHGILSIFYQYVSFGHNFFCSQLSSHYIEFYLKKERGVITDEFSQFLK